MRLMIINMIEATKFIGKYNKIMSLLLLMETPFQRYDANVIGILPYSCKTPFGFPLVPDVYTANAAA